MERFITFIIGLFSKTKIEDKPSQVISPPSDPIPQIPSISELYGFLYRIAESEIGEKESRSSENGRILQYHDATTLDASEDEVAWCASFTNWCLINLWMKYLPQKFIDLSYRIPSGIKNRFLNSNYPKTKDYLPKEVYVGIPILPTFSAAAKSFEGWGYPLNTPVKGCVTVISRSPNHSVNRHVALFDSFSKDGKFVFLLGGNQGDSVCIKKFSVEHIICFRGFYPEGM